MSMLRLALILCVPVSVETNYGTMTRNGDKVVIIGKSHWTAKGIAKYDGMILDWYWKGKKVGVGYYDEDDNGHFFGIYRQTEWPRMEFTDYIHKVRR